MESGPLVERSEIKAKINGRKLLVKILCEKRKGILVKILEALDGLKLRVGNANVVPFGETVLDITVVAEIEEELMVEEKQIVEAISGVLQAAK